MKNIIYTFFLLTFLFTVACQPKEKNMDQTNSTKKHLAFLGTYTKKEGHVDGHGMGVGIYTTDVEYKNWELKSSFSEVVNPSFICHSPNHSIIYAVNEGSGEPSTISVLVYDQEDYSIKEIQSVSSLGNGSCHVSTDRKGRFLWAANYGSGNVIQYSINQDGTLTGGVSQQHEGTGPNKDQQKGPHAHFMDEHPLRSEVYAVDLGVDKVYRYLFTVDGLALDDSLPVTPGGGCRHLVWHPDGNHVYILNEYGGTIELWEWHGSVKERQQIISLPVEGEKGDPSSAAINITADGQYLYTSMRGVINEVVVLKTNPKTYQLEIIQRVAVGSAARFMNLTPDENILTVALQDDDFILFFERDPETGMLRGEPEKIAAASPVCVVYK